MGTLPVMQPIALDSSCGNKQRLEGLIKEALFGEGEAKDFAMQALVRYFPQVTRGQVSDNQISLRMRVAGKYETRYLCDLPMEYRNRNNQDAFFLID